MTNKTFALTGGTGAIGSQFVRVLSQIKELKTIRPDINLNPTEVLEKANTIALDIETR